MIIMSSVNELEYAHTQHTPHLPPSGSLSSQTMTLGSLEATDHPAPRMAVLSTMYDSLHDASSGANLKALQLDEMDWYLAEQARAQLDSV